MKNKIWPYYKGSKTFNKPALGVAIWNHKRKLSKPAVVS